VLYAPTGNTLVYLEPDGEMGTFTFRSVADDGSAQRQLAQQRDYEVAPVWHVDGTTLLYESNARLPNQEGSTGRHIWRLQPGADGVNPLPVTNTNNAYDFTFNDNNDD
jgi:hypothetical protein